MHWAWAWVFATLAYLLPMSEFVGELPVFGSPLATTVFVTVGSIALHTVAKNTGQTGVAAMLGGWLAKFLPKGGKPK